MVDFPVPRPPIKALYCELKDNSIGPRKALLLTLMLETTADGSLGSKWLMRDSWAKQAPRSASAVGLAHLIHDEHFPRSAWFSLRLSDV
jgi:hypothetical protein